MTDSLEGQLKADFRKFLWVLWTRHLNLPQPTRLQYDIARFLQHGRKRRLIMAFRGIGKSWITAAYVLWRLWQGPNLRVLITSANEKKAVEIANFIRRLIDEVDFLQELRPAPGARDSVKAFDVGGSSADIAPSVRVDGIFGQITGARADIILSDDVEVPKNSETEAMREKLSGRTAEYAAIIKPGPEPEIIYLGTPQTEESIYRELAAKGYEVRIWPARYPMHWREDDEADPLDAYGGHLAPLLMADMRANPKLREATYGSACGGAPTDDRFDNEDLLKRELDYKQAGFTLQFMLNTRLSDLDRYPLKLRDFIVMDVSPKIAPVQLTWASGKNQLLDELPNVGFDGDRFYGPLYVSAEWLPYTGSVMVIDPHGRGKDETGYAVTKFLNGMVYVRRAGGLAGGYDPMTLRALALIAKQEQVSLILIEDNFGDGMFTQLIRPVLRREEVKASLEEYHSSGQKELRILADIEAPLQAHRIVLDKSLIERDFEHTEENQYRLFYQLTHLCRQRGALRHDDRIEALAKAIGYWVPHLDISTQDSEERHREKMMQAEIDRFMRETQGVGRKRPNWTHRAHEHSNRMPRLRRGRLPP